MNKFSYSYEDIKKLLPERKENSNKGSCGRVLIIGGSPCMAGAPYFSAKAAYRTGCGLVEVFTHEDNRVILQTLIPEAVLSTWSENIDFNKLEASIKKADVIAIGMGLSTSEAALEILLFTLEKCNCPIVIDADALNLIARNKNLFKYIKHDAIITPHPLEMSRISSVEVEEITKNIPEFAQKFANENTVICVLKDHRTAVASPDADYIYINQSGNSGMSTGGSGDVLDGIIAGLLAQGCDPYIAATLGVYIHGLAGDVASEILSQYSLMASDIIDALPEIFNSL
ncbi:MAG: NAD(P)H-hydrate dehydratase [Clostridia bacterium]|nr:NAD(P)H-hydrate dehydratase [Clostridia bacterium]